MQLKMLGSWVFQSVLRALLAVSILSVLLAWSTATQAQVLYGSLTGTVMDASGAIVPNADVTALEVTKGISAQAQSDSFGIYRLSNILPGTYKVTIAARGFSSQVTDNLVVEANALTRLDAKLSPATTTESVTVTTAPPELQTDRADVHTDLTPEELQSLPSVSSEGKNFQELLRIVPGANLPSENNTAASNPARAMTSNVNGQSAQGNSTRIDGVVDLYPWLPNNVAYVPPAAAIDTVNIATNSLDAEQGMVNGAAVNVQVKSGTNQFHGELHELHTDDGMKNQNYFSAPGYKKPLNVFNEFGGAVGGPVLRNKLFFFGDWEENRQVQSPSNGNPQTVPTGGLDYATAKQAGYFDFTGINQPVDSTGAPVHIYDPRPGTASPNGNGRAPITCNGIQDRICLSDVDPAAFTLASLLPVASQSGVLTNNFLDLQKGFFNRDDYDAKVNFVPSGKSNYFGRFSMLRGLIFDPPSLGAAGGGATNGGIPGYSYPDVYQVGLGATHTFTTNLLLDANAGFTRQHIITKDTDVSKYGDYGLDTLKIPGANDAGLPAANQLYWGIPMFEFNTYSNLGNSVTASPEEFRDNQLSGSVNLTWVKARHQFRFGFEDDHSGLNHFQGGGSGCQAVRGCFQYTGSATEQVTLNPSTGAYSATDPPKSLQQNSFADFLLGLSDDTGKAVLTVNPIALRWSQFAFYARDQWQVTPTFTLNYGIRYEIYPMAYSDHGKGAHVLNLANMQVRIGGYGSTPVNDGVNTGHGEILPRLGAAWRPNDKTVVRLGFGIGADSNSWRFLLNTYPADVLTAWSGPNTGGTVNYSQFAPADSLTGANGANYQGGNGAYKSIPTGLVLAAFPNIASGAIPLPNGISTQTIPTNFRRGYTEGYNLSVEREFAGFVADAGYVGETAIRPLTYASANWAAPGAGNSGRVLNAQFGGNWPEITELIPAFRRSYNSLQAKLSRRIGRGSTLGVIYTWSKAIDFQDNEENGQALMWNDPEFYSKNKGLAGYNRKSNFESYWVYNLPFGKGEKWATNGLGSWLAGGWQFSGVLSILSGTPSTVTDSGDSGTLNAPDEWYVPNQVAAISYTKGRPHSNPSSCTSTSCEWFNPASFARVTTPGTLGNVNRNTLIGPGYFDLDGSLHRDFKIKESLIFQLEGDAFGLTNTPHFANPTVDLNSSNFGKISSTLAVAYASLGGSGGEREFFVEGKFVF